jgi:very-short-patch-repair endonuclease
VVCQGAVGDAVEGGRVKRGLGLELQPPDAESPPLSPAGEARDGPLAGPGEGVFWLRRLGTPSPGALGRVSPLPQAGEGGCGLAVRAYAVEMSRVIRIVSPHAASLRQRMPEAEARLWRQLRDRRLMGHKFRRQHSIGPFIADFACVAARLAIELDGSQHADAAAADARRTAFLEAEGWTVIRFWNARVMTDTDNVLREIIAHLPPE